MLKKKKKHFLCILGFHKFELITKISGYVDIGSVIIRHEEIQLVCIRNNCGKTKGNKNSNYTEFRKKE